MAERDLTGDLHARDLQYEVDGARLLDGVALRAGPGELVGLIGPNGAGKSTLLRVIAGLVRRTGGEVLLEGEDLDRLSTVAVARRLALLGQHAPDTFGFTALEVVLTGRYPHLGRFEIESARDRAIAIDAMRRTDSEPFAVRDAATLSGGERQRVFLARALAQQPHLLLLDEPTASLDVRHQFAAFALMRELTQRDRITVIAAVHDLRLAARYCDRLVLMHSGRIVADSAPESVLTPSNLADVFGVRAVVFRDPATGVLTVDLHPQATEAPHRRVHVRAGGPGLAQLLYSLAAAGFDVTIDDLPAGTLDGFVADALGIVRQCDGAATADVVVDADASTPADIEVPTIAYRPGDPPEPARHQYAAPESVVKAVYAIVANRPAN